MFCTALRSFSGCKGSLRSTLLHPRPHYRLYGPPASSLTGLTQRQKHGFTVRSQRRWATSTTSHSTALDPGESEALRCLEQGTQMLEDGEIEAAKSLYKRSVEIKRTPSSLFNLGVTHYHLSSYCSVPSPVAIVLAGSSNLFLPLP
jgi:hypothetical protein